MSDTPWTSKDEKQLAKLNGPGEIQGFLDSIGYNSEPVTSSPRQVLIRRSANCFEGAMFGAMCLRRLGHPPLVVDLRAVNDDDHVIAVYRKRGLWGSVAKSNFTTLRSREPAYRSVRELAMSYFDFYFNTLGEKTLREYSVPMDLSRFDTVAWETTDDDLEVVGDMLDRVRHYRLIPGGLERELTIVDGSLLQAGLLGSNPDGLYVPGAKGGG